MSNIRKDIEDLWPTLEAGVRHLGRPSSGDQETSTGWLRKQLTDLGFHDISKGQDDLRFSIKAVLGSPHYLEIRVHLHSQGWWQCTFVDGWETSLLDPPLLEAFVAVREFQKRTETKR